MSRKRLQIDDATDRWRFRCPAGHTNWEATNQHFYCQQCARSLDSEHDPVFHELHDARSGQLYEREEIVLEGYEDVLRHPGGD